VYLFTYLFIYFINGGLLQPVQHLSHLYYRCSFDHCCIVPRPHSQQDS